MISGDKYIYVPANDYKKSFVWFNYEEIPKSPNLTIFIDVKKTLEDLMSQWIIFYLCICYIAKHIYVNQSKI